jgi:hypothetical protein
MFHVLLRVILCILHISQEYTIDYRRISVTVQDCHFREPNCRPGVVVYVHKLWSYLTRLNTLYILQDSLLYISHG